MRLHIDNPAAERPNLNDDTCSLAVGQGRQGVSSHANFHITFYNHVYKYTSFNLVQATNRRLLRDTLKLLRSLCPILWLCDELTRGCSGTALNSPELNRGGITIGMIYPGLGTGPTRLRQSCILNSFLHDLYSYWTEQGRL